MPPSVAGCINTTERPQKTGDIFPLELFQYGSSIIFYFFHHFPSSGGHMILVHSHACCQHAGRGCAEMQAKGWWG